MVIDVVRARIMARVDDIGQDAESVIGKRIAEQQPAGGYDLLRVVLGRSRCSGGDM